MALGKDSIPPARRHPRRAERPGKGSSRRRVSQPRSPHASGAHTQRSPSGAPPAADALAQMPATLGASAWSERGHTPIAETTPLEFAATGLSDVLLELLGEGTVTLRSALVAWQREQDRVLNRTWRRPGGLVRPGGV